MNTPTHARAEGDEMRTTAIARPALAGLVLLSVVGTFGCVLGTAYTPPAGRGSGGDGLAGAGGTAPSGGAGGSGAPVAGATGTAGGSTGTAWPTPVPGGPTGTGLMATVTVDPTKTVGVIDDAFAGFSLEKTAITNASLTSDNAPLIALYKLLGRPLMRLAANDVDNCNWAGEGAAPTQPSGAPFTKQITTGMVNNLCGFLSQTGTKVIYGVNYLSNNLAASSAEAAYVMSQCPSSVYAFEIGNEIEKEGAWDNQRAQYEMFSDAVLSNPGALLAGPASTNGGYLALTVPFINSEAPKYGSKFILATQHLYVAGSGTSGATVASLQAPAKAGSIATALSAACTQNNVSGRWRLGEVNTFSQHGQPGVSDTLISALWAIDIMGFVAERGATGLNFHGGETGMDGTKPFTYEPIQMTNGQVTQVQPEYYGILLFTQAGTGKVLSKTVTTNNPNFTAYAISADAGFTSVILDNRSATDGVNATVDVGAAVRSASAIYLQGTPAGSLSAPAGSVTLAGAFVTAAGTWSASPPYTQVTSGNTVSVYIPPASAALVRLLP